MPAPDKPTDKPKKKLTPGAWEEARALVWAHRKRLTLGLTLMLINRLSGVVLPATRHFGAALAIALLVMFALAMAINLVRGRTEIDCGCFKSGLRQTVSGWLVGRNLLLAAGTVLLWLPATERAVGCRHLTGIRVGDSVLLLELLRCERLHVPRTGRVRNEDDCASDHCPTVTQRGAVHTHHPGIFVTFGQHCAISLPALAAHPACRSMSVALRTGLFGHEQPAHVVSGLSGP